ncbi:MAG TPA: STAS domain-containing protein [Solirubrobacteraceae bacterium]
MREKPVDIEGLDEDGGRTLRLRGELDISSVQQLERLVQETCADGAARLRLDLRELSFIDSSGIAAIVQASSVCEEQGLDFELLEGPPAVQRLFVLTGLSEILPFRDGRDA